MSTEPPGLLNLRIDNVNPVAPPCYLIRDLCASGSHTLGRPFLALPLKKCLAETH